MGFYCIINPQGNLLATSEQFRVCVWNLPAGTAACEISLPRADFVEPLLWSADGEQLLVLENHRNGDGHFSVVNVKTGHIRSLDGELPKAVDPKTGHPADWDKECASWALRSWAEKSNPRDPKPLWFGPRGRLVETPSGSEFKRTASVAGRLLATGHQDGSIRLWQNYPLREVRRIQAHKQAIQYLVSSPDGRLLLSQETPPWSGKTTSLAERRRSPQVLCLWDVQTGKRWASFPAPDDSIADVQFIPNGRALAVLDHSRQLWVWDVKTGRPYQEARLPISGIGAFAFSRDGNSLALARKSEVVELIDLKSQRPTRRLRTNSAFIQQLIFLSDNRTLLASDRSEIGLWDIQSGKEHNLGEGHRWPASALQFSPDGRLLSSADGWGRLLVWSVAERASLPLFHGERTRQTIAYHLHADGRSLLTLEPTGDIRRWPLSEKPTSGAQKLFHVSQVAALPYSSRHYWARFLNFSPGWNSGAYRRPGGDMYVMDLRTGRRSYLPFIDTSLAETQWLFSPDEKVLAIRTADDRLIRLWDLERGKVITQFEGDAGPDTTLLFSPDSRLFAYTKVNSVRRYDLKRKLPLPELVGIGEHSNLAFDPTGRTLLTVKGGETVRLWDLRSRKLLRSGLRPERDSWLGGLEPIPQEHVLMATVFVDTEKRNRLHDPVTGIGVVSQINPPGLSDIPHLVTSPDGRIIAAGRYDVTLLDRYTGKVLGQLPHARRGTVSALAFSPSGDRLAVAAGDSCIYLWDWKEVCGLHDPRKLTLSDAELTRCWHALASDDPRPAFAAMGLLRSSPAQTLSFLRRHLQPVTDDELRPVRGLVADLDSDDFRTRQQASARLRQEMRGEWVPLLHHEVAENPSLEASTRLQDVLTRTSNFAYSPAMLRRIRAVHLLEEIGSAEATALLSHLAKGSDHAPLTSEARRAVERLRERAK